jgi:magnesium-protoporphyrin O-methyltransferase
MHKHTRARRRPSLHPAGSLAIPLALRGAVVSGSDISSSMAAEAGRRYEAARTEGGKGSASFEAKDLE